MGCSKKKVFFYLEGFLSQEEGEAFRGHLETCPICSAELGELRRLKELLGTSSEEVLEPNFSKILSDFRRKNEIKKKRVFYRLVLLPAGALAIILFLIFYLRPKEVYFPVDISYYDIIENVPREVRMEIEEKLLPIEEIEKLEEEILSLVSYEEVFECLTKMEKEAVIKKLSGGKI